MTIYIVIWMEAMGSYSVAQTKAHLSNLLEQIEQGEEILITRRGRPVARLVSAAKKKVPLDLERLRKLRATQPMAKTPAETLIRAMRNAARY